MFDWFRKKPQAPSAPATAAAPTTGPDYRHVDSREKAQALFKRGELEEIPLLPMMFGGQDIPANRVYVPAFAAAMAMRLATSTIAGLAKRGQVTRYQATPTYEGSSFVPTSLRIVAHDPGRFEATIAIWGPALATEFAAPADGEVPLPPAFELPSIDVQTLDPDAMVLAFIGAHNAWEHYAWRVDQSHPHREMAGEAAQAAYAMLSWKFCLPGHPHQPLAYGNEPTHDPARERIVDSQRTADTAVVRTAREKELGTQTVTDDYEYHLKHADGRWFVASVLYVCDDGKYEGL